MDQNNPRSVSKDWLEQLPSTLGIKWIGYCDVIDDLIANSSVVVLPSTYGEGIPKILIEAAAMGRAVVTTNWPGCNDAVKHDYNGLLVEPGNQLALTENIKKLIQNPDLRERLGGNGRRVAEENFSIDSVIQETLSIYKKLDSSSH